MLTRLQVANYRAIGPGPLEIDLAPLTVLVGPNGAGKSSILEALALTAQSASEDLTRHELVLDGTRVRAGSGLDEDARIASLHHRNEAGLPLAVAVEHDLRIGSAGYRGERTTDVIRYRWERSGGRWPRWTHSLSHGPHSLAITSSGVLDSVQYDVLVRQSGKLIAERGASNVERVLPRWQVGDTPADVRELLRTMESNRETLRGAFDDVHLLTSLRGHALVQQQTGPRVGSVGRHGENTIRLLSQVLRHSDEYLKFAAAVQAFGLPALEAGVFEANTLRAVYRDPMTETLLDLGSAATGSQHALVLATFLLLSRPHSVLLVEEPEVHLHPAYARQLPALFADAIETRHQVVIATHSEVLVAALANIVRSGRLTPHQVRVYEIRRTADRVEAQLLPIDGSGAMQGWIPSYVEAEQSLVEEWAAGAPSKGRPSRARRARPRRSGDAPRPARKSRARKKS